MIKVIVRKDDMDPSEDIIDVLYKCRDTRRPMRDALFRLPSFTRDPNQWPPPVSPTYRNYEEDLHRLRRRSLDRCNSWRGDSVYNLKPQLCRTDSRFPYPGTPRSAPAAFLHRKQVSASAAAPPPPLPPSWIEESVDESEILWNNKRDPDSVDDYLSDDFDDPFLTPMSEDHHQFMTPRSVRVDVIPQDDVAIVARRHDELIQLPNGARQLRRSIMDNQDTGADYISNHFPDSASAQYGEFSGRGIYSTQPFHQPKEIQSRISDHAMTDTFYRSDSRSSFGGGGGLYSSIGSINMAERLMPTTIAANQNNPQQMNQKMETEQTSNRWQHLLKGLSNVVGVLVMLFLANKWSNYLQTLHENELWFSNIKEVEREISFRTEQGFYYSYFKHLVKAPSLWEGKESLERDNLTEHLNTINVFQRFNIHQELFLAAIYNIYNFHLEPIFFYAEAVFSLQGLLLGALYLIAWKLSGTWLAGVLTTAFVVCNRFEVTRVEFTIALREHFALPFIFAQYAAIGHYMTVFNKKINAKTHFNNEQVHLVLIYLLTLMFSVSWQFAQFILLLQSVVLLILGTIQILDKDQVCKILFVNLMSMLTVWYLQFYQPMVLSSLVVSFIPVAIASLQSQGVRSPNNSGILPSLIQSIIRTFFVLVAAVAVNIMAKVALNQNDDNHIFSFVKSKLGFIDETNFESRMYRCLPAFQAMHFAFYVKMTNALLMPLYLMYVGSRCLFIVASVFNNWSQFETEVAKKKKDDDYDQKKKDSTVSGKGTNVDGSAVIEADFLTNPLAHMDARPAECFHVCQSLVLGAMAMTTLRMKCLWCPYICVMASVMLCDRDLWRFVTKRLIGTSVQVENSEKQTPSTPKTGQKNSTRIISSILRHFVLIFAIMILVNNNKDNIYKELEDLKEFWDPDTVDLMEWIQASTPPTAAFTGSMQLLAGVRLCTWRPITNHPHFEDKALRDRTKELYSIYAKISPEKVHKILTKYNSSYIILEDSICLQAGRHTDRCSLPDTMDLALGHIPDDGIVDLPHLKSSKYPRFCKEIRYGAAAYGKLFKKVFENKTFRVYKVV